MKNRQTKKTIDLNAIIRNGGATLDKNGSAGSFSADMLNDLKSDSAIVDIMDNETGEIIFIND